MPIPLSRSHRQYLQSTRMFPDFDVRGHEWVVIDGRADQKPRRTSVGETGKSSGDPLASARGILNGLSISLLLWGLVGFVFLLAR